VPHKQQQRQGRTLRLGGAAAPLRSQMVLLWGITPWCLQLLLGLVRGAAAAGAGARPRSRAAAARVRALRRQQLLLLQGQGHSRLLLAVVLGALRRAPDTARQLLQLRRREPAGARARGRLGRVELLVGLLDLVGRGEARASDGLWVGSTCIAVIPNTQGAEEGHGEHVVGLVTVEGVDDWFCQQFEGQVCA
jgi:hypothetical protein